MQKYALGLKGPDRDKARFSMLARIPTSFQLPKLVSYEYLFEPCADQGQRGACVFFATSAMYEACLKKHHGIDLSVSRRAQYRLTQDHYEPQSAGQDVGAYAQDALSTLKDVGHVLASDWAYDVSDADFLEEVPANLVRANDMLGSFARVGGSETADIVHAIKAGLYAHGPVALGVSWYNDWFTPENGNLTAEPTQGVAGGHEIVAAAFSDARQAVKIRNSWGPTWPGSLDGYAWMPYSVLKEAVSDAYTLVV